MFNAIKSLFGRGVNEEAPQDQIPEIPLAAAVLLVEAALMDGSLAPVEEKTILEIMQKKMDCSGAEARELLQLAEQQLADKDHFYYHTKVLKDNLDEAGRLKVVEMLWEVVLADGEIDDYEANLMRRVSGLLFVTDPQTAQLKQKVKKRMKAANDHPYTDEEI